MIKDRIEAGKLLAKRLAKHNENALVLSIPRGGVVIGNEIAKELGCRLDVIISKKVTPPDNPEYAIGAITHDGTVFQGENWEVFSKHPDFENELNKKKEEVQRRLKDFRGSSDYKFDNKTVILVDDGIATGATVFAILNWLKKQKVKKIILAVPVMPSDTFQKMQKFCDEIIVLEIPHDFVAVGQFYHEFLQVSDDQVISILEKFRRLESS